MPVGAATVDLSLEGSKDGAVKRRKGKHRKMKILETLAPVMLEWRTLKQTKTPLPLKRDEQKWVIEAVTSFCEEMGGMPTRNAVRNLLRNARRQHKSWLSVDPRQVYANVITRLDRTGRYLVLC
jgi:hypothetical protein